jgi:tRNA (guanine-N7-)-methyltransferase
MGIPFSPPCLSWVASLECRSNWPIYLMELCFAVQRLTQRAALCEPYLPEQPLTPFERKYLASNHRLFRTVIDLA